MDLSLVNEVIMLGNPLLIPLIIGLGLQAVGTGFGIAQNRKQMKMAEEMKAEGDQRLNMSLQGMRETIAARQKAYDNIFGLVYGGVPQGFSGFGSTPSVPSRPMSSLGSSGSSPLQSSGSRRGYNVDWEPTRQPDDRQRERNR